MTPAVALRDTAGIAKRYLLRTIRMPAEASVLVIQPALILLLFRYVLGGAIKVPGGSYADFLVPAVFIEAMLLSGMSTSIGLTLDLKSGIIDRFRSLPMARSAVLACRTLRPGPQRVRPRAHDRARGGRRVPVPLHPRRVPFVPVSRDIRQSDPPSGWPLTTLLASRWRTIPGPASSPA